MVMTRVCDCGAIIPPTSGGGRPRIRCVECAPPRAEHVATTKNVTARQLRINAERKAERDPEFKPGAVEESVRETLHAAHVYGQPKAVIAMRLARILDRGGESAAGYASLSRELRTVLDEALSAANAAADPLNELLAARRERRNA